jgi:hypothetical protein
MRLSGRRRTAYPGQLNVANRRLLGQTCRHIARRSLLTQTYAAGAACNIALPRVSLLTAAPGIARRPSVNSAI